MSGVDALDRSAFQSDQRGSDQEAPPISRMAVASLVLGVLSLLSPLTIALVPICFVAAVLGAIAVFRIARDPVMAGALPAQIGLGLGVLSAMWAITATSREKEFLDTSAGQHAETFLDILAAGKKYEALELMRIEPQRQTTGTDLEEYYENGTTENQEELAGFLGMQAIQVVLGTKDADWTYVRGVNTHRIRDIANITVEMQNLSAKPELQLVYVTLERNAGFVTRDAGKATALWNVLDLAVAALP